MMRTGTLRRRPASSAICAALAIATGTFLSRPAAALADDCRRGGEPTAVIAACSFVIASSRDARAVERAHNLRGLAYETTGQFQPAVDDASEVIRRDPRVAGFFDNRARAYRGLGRLDLALKDADTAVRMAPGYAFVFRGRGLVYSDLGRYDLAARDFGAGVAIDPADAGLRVERGRAVAMLDRPEDALADFSAALALRPGDAAALRERGLVRRRLGDDEGARVDLQAALAATPGDEVAAEALRGLEPSTTPDPRQTRAVAQLKPLEKWERESDEQLRKEQAAAEAARIGRARLAADRLAHVVEDARRVLNDAADFAAANGDDASIEEHLRRMRRLQSAADGTDPDVIVSDTQDLRAGLSADPVYVGWRAASDASAHTAQQQRLNEALRLLRTQRTFLIGAASRDALSSTAIEFGNLADQVTAVQEHPDLGRAETLTGQIDQAITRAGLTQRYAVFARQGGNPSPSGERDSGRTGAAAGIEPQR